MCLTMMAPVLGDMLAQVRRGDVLPASILAVYVLIGFVLYVAYGQRRSRRLAGVAHEQ
jgi:APA family basic amino acid/polyamine antiporter